MKKLILILCFALLSIVIHSQNYIGGLVQNEEGEPLVGVEIYSPNVHLGTTTNDKGIYKLENLPHGEVILTFSYFGYETVSETFDLHRNIKHFNVVLKETVFQVDEVIISTPFNRLQSKNVMKVEVAKIKTMQQTGVSTLTEGLEQIPGVSQISTGTSIGKPVIRGLSGNRVLVYTQGVRLENQQFGDEHGLGLNAAGIQSVEVIKGPASLLYGSDALGGVLYFNPERFSNNNTTSADFSSQYFSNTNGLNSTVGVKTSFDKLKFLVRGTYDTHEDYKVPNGDKVTNTRYNEFNFNTGVGFNSARFATEFRYDYTQSKIGLTEGIEEQESSRTPELPYQEINNHILSLHNHLFFDTSKLDLNFGYIVNERFEFEDEHDHDDEEHEDEEENEEHEEEHAALQMKLKTLNYDIKYHAPEVDDMKIIVGVQGMHQTNTNYGEELLIPDARINDFGIFTTAIIDIEENSLHAGIRFDHRNLDTYAYEHEHDGEIETVEAISNNYNSITGSLGYRFEIANQVTSRINAASGFRAPNLAELTSDGIHHGSNRYEIGNPDLTNEQNFQFDAVFEYDSKHFEVFVNAFYNIVKNYNYLNPSDEFIDETQVFYYTQEDAKLYGGEIGLHLHPHPLDWLHYESTFEMVVGELDSGEYLPLIPANKWDNTFRGEFNANNWLEQGFARINISSTFSQTNVAEFETTSDAYTLVNLGVGGTVKLNKIKFETSINLNNAFNKEYIAHLSRLKNDNIYNIGRNLIIGLNFKF